MTEFQILSAVKNNGGCMRYVDLLNLNLTDVNRDPLADKARISKMIEAKLLEGKTEAYCSISITKEGRLFLQDAYYIEEQNSKLAYDRANEISNQKRHDLWVALIGAVVGSLSGIILDVVILLLEH